MRGTKKLVEKKRIVAISGIKNSGKTTLICRLLENFKEKGLRVAVLKHDGHDFKPDVPGTDTYRQLQAGAYGTVVFFERKIYAGKAAATDYGKRIDGSFFLRLI